MMRSLRGFAALLLVGLGLSLGRADELQPLTVRDFSPGMATENDSSIICDGCGQDMLNVDVESGSIEKRRGSIKVNSTAMGGFTAQPVKLIHAFDDANDTSWIITHSSNSLLKSNDGGVTWSTLTSTHGVTADNRFCAVNAFNKARLTDGTTHWILWDGTSVSVSTASPKSDVCEFFAERVWGSVGSFLQASKNGDPEDWTQDALTDDDAFFTYIRQNDGYDIRALKRFKNGLLVFKDYSTDFLVLNQDGLTFTVLPISSRVGTQQSKSVVERENDVVWMAHDGYYSYDGAVLRRISDAIDPTFNQIRQLSVGAQTYTETGQGQFVAGTNTQTTPYITAGDVLLSTWTASDALDADFSAFTSSSNINITSDRIYLSTNNTNVENNSFEVAGASSLHADGWDLSPGPPSSPPVRNSAVAAQDGTYYMSILSVSGQHYLNVLDTDGNVLVSTQNFATTTSWVQFSYSLSAYAGRWIKLRFSSDGFGSGYTVTTSSPILCNGGTITWYARNSGGGSAYVDMVEGGRSTIYSGSLTGQTRDTTYLLPYWLASAATYADNSHSVTFQTETSANGSSWDSPVSWTDGAAPASANKRYIRWSVVLSTGGTTDGVALPYVETVPLAAKAGAGRYLSSAIDTSAGTSWNPFSVLHTPSGGAMTFEIYQDTDTVITPTNATTFISSQTITNGATPSVAFSNYSFVGTTFTITAGTQEPSLQEFTLSWNEGSGGNFPVAATYYQGSYITAVAISSATGNDRMLVYDRNGAWTVYGYPAYSLGIYRQKPYFGSNLQGDFVRFQADDIYNDYDASAISSYWISKDFDFGYPLTSKTITRYYVTGAYELNSDALFEWGVNRGSLTSESTLGVLDLDLNSGFFRKSINPSSLTYKKGISHRLKFSDSEVDDYFKILSFTIKANLETSP